MLQRPIEPDYITECEDWHNVTLTIHGCGRRTLSAPGAAAYRFEGTLMLAYLAQGSGVLSSANKEFLVAEGQGFLVPPKLDYTFRADEDETCVLYWVEFFGSYVEKYLMRARLMADTPIFSYERDDAVRRHFIQLVEVSKLTYNRYCKMIAELYLILSHLIDDVQEKSDMPRIDFGTQEYVWQALRYIESNYMNPIRIEDLATHVGLSRKYFYHVFQRYLHMSPQAYIIRHRMTIACEILHSGRVLVEDVARAVGYTDTFHFTKMFKKVVGVTPGVYAKSTMDQSGLVGYYRAEIMKLTAQLTETMRENETLRALAGSPKTGRR